MHENVNLKRSGSNARSGGAGPFFYVRNHVGARGGLVERKEKVGKIYAVDGRNPAPPGVCKPCKYGMTYQLVQDFGHQQYGKLTKVGLLTFFVGSPTFLPFLGGSLKPGFNDPGKVTLMCRGSGLIWPQESWIRGLPSPKLTVCIAPENRPLAPKGRDVFRGESDCFRRKACGFKLCHNNSNKKTSTTATI